MFISKEEFECIENYNGVYVFVYESMCPLCKIHVDSLYNNGIRGFTIILLENDDELDWMQEKFKCEGVPHTLVYKNNDVIWQKNNVFFKKQIKELNSHINN